MRTKILIAGGIILFLWLAKKKADAKKEDKKLEAALKENEMPAAQQIDVVRLKIDDFLLSNWPFMNEDERMATVIDLTTDLENYTKKYVQP